MGKIKNFNSQPFLKEENKSTDLPEYEVMPLLVN